MDRLTEIELFVQTAELGSLSKAAEMLGMSNAAASRHLASLEQRLSAGLVQRTTRRLTLSEVGESYFHRCKAILAELREAEGAASSEAVQPRGTLRISASLSFSIQHIAPLLSQYTARYPNVTTHIEVTERCLDLIDSNIDVAIRERENDSNVTVRRLAESRCILCASPDYIKQHGAPLSVQSLSSRPMLINTYGTSFNELQFRSGAETEQVKVKGLLESNDGQLLRAAALEGLGILVQPKYVVYDDLASGRLVSVLDEWDLPRVQITIAFQNRRYLPAKVRTFIDFLVQHFRFMEFERKWTEFDRTFPAINVSNRRQLKGQDSQVIPIASNFCALAH